jgi:hypothetical protein
MPEPKGVARPKNNKDAIARARDLSEFGEYFSVAMVPGGVQVRSGLFLRISKK